MGFATGTVSRVFYKEKNEEKGAFASVSFVSEDYFVPKGGGQPQLRKDYLSAIAYGAIADAMKDLAVGDAIAVHGKPKAGRPYSKTDDDGNINWYASQEMIVSNWELMGCADDGTSEAGNLEKADGEEESPADGETDPFSGNTGG
jgi:hypothetical protein